MQSLPEYLLFDQLREQYDQALREAVQVKHKRSDLLNESRRLIHEMRKIMDDPPETKPRPKRPAPSAASAQEQGSRHPAPEL